MRIAMIARDGKKVELVSFILQTEPCLEKPNWSLMALQGGVHRESGLLCHPLDAYL